MSIIKTFPNQYINKLATAIMLDGEVNKLLYYNDVLDKDIYSLPEVKNPISELKDKNVYINRRVSDLFNTSNDADVFVFINLYSDAPCSIGRGKSRYIDRLRIDVGVICNDSVRNTLNGCREAIIFDRIVEILEQTEYLEGIGKPEIGASKQSYSIPYGYNAYVLTVEVDYFHSW